MNDSRQSLRLPEGRAGQAAALGITVLLLLAFGAGVARPALGWYRARATHVAMLRLRIAHERALVAALPQFERAARRHDRTGARTDLPGETAALAGARLQGIVQGLATARKTRLDSAELLTPAPLGAVERIRLRVAMTTDYATLIRLLGDLARQHPSLIVGNLAIHVTTAPDPGRSLPVQAQFTVSGFRRAATHA